MDPVENIATLSNDELDSEEEFLALKHQLHNVESLTEECNRKIVDKTLSQEDLTNMVTELRRMTEFEHKMSPRKMRSYYGPYRALALKMIQEWYLTCDGLMQKQCGEIENFKECCNKKNQLAKINTMPNDVFKNTDGNIRQSVKLTTEPVVLTQVKRQQRISQNRQLTNRIISVEVENKVEEYELQLTGKG